MIEPLDPQNLSQDPTEYPNKDLNEELSTPKTPDPGLRLGRKITAVGFIIVVLAGNFWWVEFALRGKVHPYLESSFFIGIIIAIVGGLLMAFRKLMLYIQQIWNE